MEAAKKQNNYNPYTRKQTVVSMASTTTHNTHFLDKNSSRQESMPKFCHQETKKAMQKTWINLDKEQMILSQAQQWAKKYGN